MSNINIDRKFCSEKHHAQTSHCFQRDMTRFPNAFWRQENLQSLTKYLSEKSSLYEDSSTSLNPSTFLQNFIEQTHREIFSEPCWIKPNLDCNYTIPDLFSTSYGIYGIPLGVLINQKKSNCNPNLVCFNKVQKNFLYGFRKKFS